MKSIFNDVWAPLWEFTLTVIIFGITITVCHAALIDEGKKRVREHSQLHLQPK